MSEVKILDLPVKHIDSQDYALIVSPDGTHSRGLYSQLTTDITDEVIGNIPDVFYNDTYDY